VEEAGRPGLGVVGLDAGAGGDPAAGEETHGVVAQELPGPMRASAAFFTERLMAALLWVVPTMRLAFCTMPQGALGRVHQLEHARPVAGQGVVDRFCSSGRFR
jgi:hypothetical protein